MTRNTGIKAMMPLAAAGCIALLAGCASPEYRINKNPELFATFPPEAQDLIRQGQVDIGFDPDMVRMALGEPRRTYTRRTKEGDLVVWSYITTFTTTDRQRVRADFRYRGADGVYRSGSDWVDVDVPRETEYERLRVEFSDGKVSAIETLER